MNPNDTLPKPQHMQSHRSGASRKLLSRKPGDKAMAAQGEALEDVFPGSDADAAAEPTVKLLSPGALGDEDNPACPALLAGGVVAGPEKSSAAAGSDAQTEAESMALPTGPSWTDEQEELYVAMTARRRASGYQRRGRDVGGQVLCVGSITPNPGTVVATIVELFGTRNAMARTELLDAVASASFSNAKAKPTDRTWANGYIAGALRDGFLAIAAADEARVESSPAVPL
jgi:hypothetical protein